MKMKKGHYLVSYVMPEDGSRYNHWFTRQFKIGESASVEDFINTIEQQGAVVIAVSKLA
jgi:hypothetical protein